PRLVAEDQPTADAGDPEDADQAVIALARAEVELGFGRDLDVVADPHRGPKFLLQRRAVREAALPAGEVAGAADDAGLLVGVAGRADPDPLQVGALDPGVLGRRGQRVGHRRGDVGGPAFGRRRSPCFALDRPVRVDHSGLDLGAAEVDAAAQVAHRREVYVDGPKTCLYGRFSAHQHEVPWADDADGVEDLVGEAALVRAQPAALAPAADRSPRRPRRLLRPLSGRGGDARGARR